MEAKFILSKKTVKEQVEKLSYLGFRISYSYKTNHEVGNVLQEICSEVDFSIHAKQEIEDILNKSLEASPQLRNSGRKIWFFTQAESEEELKKILQKEIRNFVIDNEIDLERILNVIKGMQVKINLSLRMKFQEHRIGSGKYFVYGMASSKVNDLIRQIRNEGFIDKLGIHIHRKSQNTSEWRIKEEIQDSLDKDVLEKIDFLNFGGGLPIEYRGYTSKVLPYIFSKLVEAKEFLEEYNVESIIEPGRFVAAPAVRLETEIIQIHEKNIILNTTIYNCALDCILTGTKMLVEQELGDEQVGEFYLLKGNSPTRDDIFRYKVKLRNPKIGDKIVFLNAGAYNYTTDFFGHKKLNTEIVEDF